MPGELCPNCGEFMESKFDPNECPLLEYLKWRFD